MSTQKIQAKNTSTKRGHINLSPEYIAQWRDEIKEQTDASIKHAP